MRLLLLILTILTVTPPLPAEDMLDEFEEEVLVADDSWWNPAWRYRRTVEIRDPRLQVRQSSFARLAAPEPLLLYNVGRTAPALRDIRLIGPNGQPLTAGVVGWPLDDGSCQLWVKLPEMAADPLGGKDKLRVQLYYGYEGEEALPELPEPPLIDLLDTPFLVQLADEEVRPGATAAPFPDAEAFFRDLVIVEGETLRDSRGRDGFVNDRVPERRTFAIGNLQPASGGYYLAPDRPWRRGHEDYPVTLHGSVRLPTAGTWYVHVRYAVSQYVILKGKLEPKRYHYRLYPFQLRIGEQTLDCGAEQQHGASFRYDHFSLDLPAGELPLEAIMTAPGGLDCIVFTRHPDYVPDIADFGGPVHMRFRLNEAPVTRFVVGPYCVIRPWTSHGPEGQFAGYLLRDQVAPNEAELNVASRDPANLLTTGVWTPWIAMLTSAMPMWWTSVRVWEPGKRPVGDCAFSFEFATRPHPSRVFRSGQEIAERPSGLNVIMPTSTDLTTTLARTLSFGQWAEQRYQTVLELGLEVTDKPERIHITSMATADSSRETDYILRTLNALGFNGAEVRTPMTDDAYWELCDELNLPWSTAHHWHPKIDYAEWPEKPSTGQTPEVAAKELIDQAARDTYSTGGRRWRYDTPRTRLLIMGDEIGPFTNPPMINNVPLIKGWFHAFLQAQGLTPDFFGKTTWDEIDALWYVEVSPTSELGEAVRRIREARGLEVEDPYAPDAPKLPAANLEMESGASADDLLESMTIAEDERQAARFEAKAPADADLYQKRLYHWTQKFRGQYTYYVYRQSQRQIDERVAAGDFLYTPYCSPNFQALPIMRTQMWDGALNLFEWARQDTTNTLFIEDWIVHPYRVGYGFQLLRSAARLHDQKLGLLVVGGNMAQRYYAALANGAEVFLSYLYGPLRVIGPPWAEHEPTMRQWSSVLAATARCEDDLLAVTPRPAQVAILMAVTSDINSVYRNPNPTGYQMSDRASIYAALQDSGIPCEIISEEELLDDPAALQRYQVLYVPDPHVDSRVQQTIHDWVRAGGLLWGNYLAMARQEYDQPSPLMTPVFGLISRAPLQDLGRDNAWEDSARQVTVPDGIDGLAPVTFQSASVPTDWRLNETAEVLAAFQDGQPAFIRHAYGQGTAYLFAGTVMPLTGGYGRESSEPPYAAATRRIVTLPVRQAGIMPHLELSHPRVMSYVSDGPNQTVVFLINCFENDLTDLTASVKLSRQPTSAFNSSGDPLDWTWQDGQAIFTVAIPKLDGRIIVFRH